MQIINWMQVINSRGVRFARGRQGVYYPHELASLERFWFKNFVEEEERSNQYENIWYSSTVDEAKRWRQLRRAAADTRNGITIVEASQWEAKLPQGKKYNYTHIYDPVAVMEQLRYRLRMLEDYYKRDFKTKPGYLPIPEEWDVRHWVAKGMDLKQATLEAFTAQHQERIWENLVDCYNISLEEHGTKRKRE